MITIRQLYNWLLSLARRGRLEREMEEEMRFHLEMQIEQNLASGMAAEEARFAARRQFGNQTWLKEVSREMWSMRSIETLMQDLRYGARMLMKNPGFTLIVVVTLSLGIGANTAIFSVVNAVLLRPLPYMDSGRLAMVWTDDPRHDVHEEGVSYPTFDDWRKMNRSFVDMAICSRNQPVTLNGASEPQRVEAAIVSANFFSVLGVPPMLGRSYSAEEVEHGERVIVLSHGLWQRSFGGSPSAIGKTLRMDGIEWRVIGVMPASFQFPSVEVQCWEQLTAFRRWRNIQRERYSDWGRVIGRLKPGVSVAQAQSEMNAIGQRLTAAYPASGSTAADFAGFGVNVVPLRLQITGRELPLALWVLFGAVLFVLLIACVNVANLLLARGVTRERELAVRAALGASRWRIVRQLLTESMLLAAAGGALGLLLAQWGVPLILAVGRNAIPHAAEVRLDTGVLAFTLGVSLFAGALSGLAPALRLSHLGSALNRRSSSASMASTRLRNVLVIVEFALSAMLLCGAGLLIRSFLRLQAVDSGFRPEKVLTMRIAASGSEDSYTTFYGQVLERVNALPSVKATGIIEDVMQRRNPDYVINLAGRAAQPSEPVSGDAISPGCFEALGVRLLKGRWFSDQDKGGPPVAIINETMARHFWPGEEVVGKQFREADQKPNHPWYAVVGVVTDMRRQGVERQPIAQIFWPYFQRQSWTMDLVVRTASDPANLASAVRQEIRSLDKNTPVFNVSTLERRLAESLSPQRFQSLLLGVLALLALALAAVGIYGIMRYAVAQRTHELGIRLALGAQVQDVFRLILGQGIRLVLFGMGFGLAGALALARVLRSLLYEVSTSDPLTFAGIAVLLTGVALLACWIPARRATKVDPMVALRSE